MSGIYYALSSPPSEAPDEFYRRAAAFDDILPLLD
jgi:hypothetical protein